MAKSKEQRQAARDARSWNKMSTDGEVTSTPATTRKSMDELRDIANRALAGQVDYDQAKTAGTLKDNAKTMVRPTSAPHKDFRDMPGGYSYRLYDDGALEIIEVPAGKEKFLNSFPKQGGVSYKAIFKQVTGSPPEAKAVQPAVASKAATPEPPSMASPDLAAQVARQEEKLEKKLLDAQAPAMSKADKPRKVGMTPKQAREFTGVGRVSPFPVNPVQQAENYMATGLGNLRDVARRALSANASETEEDEVE
jgi:hypothetical protein